MNRLLFGLFALTLAACRGGGSLDVKDKPADDTDPVLLAGTLTAGDTTPAKGAVTIGLLGVDTSKDDFVHDGTTLAFERLGSLGGSLSFALEVPTTPPDEDFRSSESNKADEELAVYLLLAWVDDGDGDYEDGEPLIGGHSELLVFLRNGVSRDAAKVGAEEGWNLWALDLTDETDGTATPIPEGADDLSVSANLSPAKVGDLPLYIGPALGTTVNIDILNANEDLSPASETLDTIVGVDATQGGASGTFGRLPTPADDFFGDEGGIEIAMFYALAYEDLNSSGTYEPSDLAGPSPVVAMSAAADPPGLLLYIRSTDPVAAVFMGAYGLQEGWQAVQYDEPSDELVPIKWSEGLVLVSP